MIEIGLMTLDDVDAVSEIEKQCFAVPWSREAFVREVTENVCARYLVAREDGVPVAYAGMWLVMDEAHVTNVAVRKDKRRALIGPDAKVIDLVSRLPAALYQKALIRGVRKSLDRSADAPAR